MSYKVYGQNFPKVFKNGHSVILYLCTPSLHTSVHFPTELTCVVCPKTPIHSTYVYSTRVLLYILTQLLAPNSHNWVFVPKKTIIQKLSSNLYSELFKCLATVSRVFWLLCVDIWLGKIYLCSFFCISYYPDWHFEFLLNWISKCQQKAFLIT